MRIQLVFWFILMSQAQALAGEFDQGNVFGEPEVLAVDEAFSLDVVRDGAGLQLLWQIQPGYYLYRHRVGVIGSDRVGKPRIPEGIHKEDEYFGEVQVFYESLVVDVPVKGAEVETFLVEYQGCAEAGICYPPQKRQYIK